MATLSPLLGPVRVFLFVLLAISIFMSIMRVLFVDPQKSSTNARVILMKRGGIL